MNTVKRYQRFLEISYQAVLLRPLLPTLTAQLVKSPKVYWTDPGIARSLCGKESLDDGPFFETAVFDEILRWLSWQDSPPEVHYYRVYGGAEIDFILSSRDLLLAIEAKASRGEPGPVHTLRRIVSELKIPGTQKDTRRLCLIVNRGREVIRIEPGVWSVPFERLFSPV